MSKITIYTTMLCPYCVMAKRLLKKKNVAYDEVDVSRNRDLRATMVTRSGGASTVPQIFIDEHHVGGCDELYALDDEGKLDALLTSG